MKQLRGQLTERIKEKSKELLGYKITQEELRLMVHIQYVLTNEQVLKHELLKTSEIVHIVHYMEKGYLSTVNNRLKTTKEFWDILSEIIYLSYVDLKD